ncbi:competence type IV pilus minor pilin ComGF [Carnobacterium divergens]|uniref:competence type IV pilus minor pilin ComGF n=1 Tax=Carnobacterium divergens TaxID=2748 RepID=UPI0014302D4C|nr:competence type IV pilus minor pilin ComGF [Carnobacterium divergens]
MTNQKGFTLIETLCALFILVLSISLLSISVSQFQLIRRQTFQDRQLEWHLFLNQLEKEWQNQIVVKVTQDNIQTENAKGMISYYENYQKMVRKRTIKGGHQPLLVKVESLTFQKNANSIVLEVQFENQERYRNQLPSCFKEELKQ